jgi:hypothetical protein
MLSINRGIRLDSVEKVEAGEKIDSSDGQQILRLSVSRRKERGDVAQLVRALPCHQIHSTILSSGLTQNPKIG